MWRYGDIFFITPLRAFLVRSIDFQNLHISTISLSPLLTLLKDNRATSTRKTSLFRLKTLSILYWSMFFKIGRVAPQMGAGGKLVPPENAFFMVYEESPHRRQHNSQYHNLEKGSLAQGRFIHVREKTRQTVQLTEWCYLLYLFLGMSDTPVKSSLNRERRQSRLFGPIQHLDNPEINNNLVYLN